MKKYYLFFLSIICIGLTIEPTFATNGATTLDDYTKFFSNFYYDTILTGVIRGAINGLTDYNLTGYSGHVGFIGSLINIAVYIATFRYFGNKVREMFKTTEVDGKRFSKDEYKELIMILVWLVLILSPLVGKLLTGLVAYIKYM